MEFLKQFLGEELYAQVEPKLKAAGDKLNLANLASGEYVAKGKYTELNDRVTALTAQLTERDGQLETLKKSAGDSESLKTQIKALQDDNAAKVTEYQKQTEALARSYALKDALTSTYKAKNAKAVESLLDNDSIIYKDGKFTGLEEQMKALQASDAYLFNSTPNPGTGGAPSGGSAYQGQGDMSKLSDAEYYATIFAQNKK